MLLSLALAAAVGPALPGTSGAAVTTRPAVTAARSARGPACGTTRAWMPGVRGRALAAVTWLPALARPLGLAVRRGPRAGAVHGELGRLPRGCLAFDTWQDGADQSPMHVAFVSGWRGADRRTGCFGRLD